MVKNITPEQFNDLVLRVARSSAVVKMVCGVSNNATWLLVRYAHDQAKKSRRYNGKVKKLFKQALEEWHHYEHNLIYARENRMFHLDDLEPSVRRKYGDITDREYYDFWASTGSQAYQQSKPLITSLWNKYRLSLTAHGVSEPDMVAWLLTAEATLELTEQLYERAIRQCREDMRVPDNILRGVFNQFRLTRLHKRWTEAMKTMAKDCEFKLDDIEKRNISHGVTQLCEAWIDPSMLYQSIYNSVAEYDEIFKSPGFQKMVINEIAELQDETDKEPNLNHHEQSKTS